MQKYKSNIKKEFKKRLYNFALRLIEFIDSLGKDNILVRIEVPGGKIERGNYET